MSFRSYFHAVGVRLIELALRRPNFALLDRGMDAQRKLILSPSLREKKGKKSQTLPGKATPTP